MFKYTPGIALTGGPGEVFLSFDVAANHETLVASGEEVARVVGLVCGAKLFAETLLAASDAVSQVEEGCSRESVFETLVFRVGFEWDCAEFVVSHSLDCTVHIVVCLFEFEARLLAFGDCSWKFHLFCVFE